MSIKLYNTLTRQKEEFIPLNVDGVGIYSCGPTVYNYAHIGNLRTYVFSDILCRSLRYCNYNVRQVMNITDIGHLSSDADTGEDKMTKGLLREGKELTLKNMRELAEFYTEKFKEDAKLLNIRLTKELYFASDYIKEDIELIKKLEKRGYTYKTSDGIYFDTKKTSDYGALWGGKRILSENENRIVKNPEKKNPEDFALWKFDNKIGFKSLYGQGFPGWHLECSAISMNFLGEQFDIHTGGVDHISIHHTNERAQSESATGRKPYVNFWMHGEFVDISGAKMAKAEDNFLKLSNLIERGINPISYRFWLLMASYRTKVNFVWEALDGADVALKRLYSMYLNLGNIIGEVNIEYKQKFRSFIEDDLDTPKAIALLWDLFKDEKIPAVDKKATILDFDHVLGLRFKHIKEDEVNQEIIELAEKRKEARDKKDFTKSDELRAKINALGYEVKDLPAQTGAGGSYKISKI